MQAEESAPAGLVAALAALEQRIESACAAADRPRAGVCLLAVTKTVPLSRIAEAAALGIAHVGENYVQEALAKQAALAGSTLVWHHIGPIQSNKTAAIAEHFEWAQGVDREKIALRLSEQRPADRPPLNVCVQVNVSGEASKSGCRPEDALALCQRVAALSRLRLRGLMALPAPAEAVAEPEAAFRQMRELFERLRAAGLAVDTLSMGMSDDLEAAIAHGSTQLRIGTALFGARS